MEHPIPDGALDGRLGFIGMTGSGKTYGTGTCIERILAKRDRVIILDPLGVWWGLRQMADGKTASPYEIVIFGGPHADLPITPNAGAIIGETVAHWWSACCSRCQRVLREGYFCWPRSASGIEEQAGRRPCTDDNRRRSP